MSCSTQLLENGCSVQSDQEMAMSLLIPACLFHTLPKKVPSSRGTLTISITASDDMFLNHAETPPALFLSPYTNSAGKPPHHSGELCGQQEGERLLQTCIPSPP